MQRHFNAAPWPWSLKLMTALASLALLAASVALVLRSRTLLGIDSVPGLALAGALLLVLAGCMLLCVRGYAIEGHRLQIHRLITVTEVPLDGLTRVWADPAACKGSVRMFGNGGLFAFTGWFYNRGLGRYRAFITDFRHAVVLRLPERTVVISPADPQGFIHQLVEGRPQGLKVGPEVR